MDDFSRLLAYFADPKVQALILQSDRAIAVRINGELAALSPTPLSDSALRQILYRSALAPQLDALGDRPIDIPIPGPQGIDLTVSLRLHRGGIHCGVSRASQQRSARDMSIPPKAPKQRAGLRGRTVAPQGRKVPPPEQSDQGQDAAGLERPSPTAQHASRAAQQASRAGEKPGQNNSRAGEKPGQHASRAGEKPAQHASRAAEKKTGQHASRAAEKTGQHASRAETAGDGDKPKVRRIFGAHQPLQRNKGSRSTNALQKHLILARQLGATDIHIATDTPLMLRRMGQLERHGEAIASQQMNELIELLTRDERCKNQLQTRGYADLAYEDPEEGRFRVNLCRHKRGLKACLRVLPQEPPTLSKLGLPEELSEVLKHHQGMAVIAGPNGQGKSTTLAALVNKLNQERAIHIITVEDPIEVVHPVGKAVISQRQVGRDTKSFQSALKAALREDPDVIILGELRDRETVEMALSAAETGHLVIATMNTPSGAKTIGRLIDLFPPDDQSQVRATLAGTLMVVAAQRLVPNIDRTQMVAAVELITGGIPLWSLIRDNKLVQLPGLMQRGKRMGMIQLEDSLRSLAQRGIIDDLTVQRTLALERGPTPQPTSENSSSNAPPPAPETTTGGIRGMFQRKSS